ncbi:MAG: hypothetical protein E6G83_10735 [Alphaproteobacteria bacterium]|nr:MAG: hypothetical protein E6G83_10735 [Alphaproteobacteria bacterium]
MGCGQAISATTSSPSMPPGSRPSGMLRQSGQKFSAPTRRRSRRTTRMKRARQVTFVLAGAGPTGVELAGSIAEMAAVALRSNFRRIDPAKTSILRIEGGKRILPSYAESLSKPKKAARRLEKLGVTVMAAARIEHVAEHGVIVGGNRIESATVLWTAGVAPSPILTKLGVKTDQAGRVCVGPFPDVPD